MFTSHSNVPPQESGADIPPRSATTCSKVTIGLPVYNGAETLDKALRALTAQDYPHLVIQISDNSSTDETPTIIDKWAAFDSRITVYRQPMNIGAAQNFDWVLREASTEWFMFAAHDDEWSPNYISALIACANSVINCQMALPKVIFTFPDDRKPIIRALDESIFGLEGFRKNMALMRAANGAWIYGLYRRQHLLDAFEASASFPHTWGRDLVLLLPSILRGAIAGTNDAVFTHLETTLSRERYRPSTSSAQFALSRDFIKTALDILHKEVPSRIEYYKYLLPVLRYADTHGFKIRRAVKSYLKELLFR